MRRVNFLLVVNLLIYYRGRACAAAICLAFNRQFFPVRRSQDVVVLVSVLKTRQHSNSLYLALLYCFCYGGVLWGIPYWNTRFLGASLRDSRRRAEYGFREHGFKHRTQWVFWGSLSSGEQAQWVPLSLLPVCQNELTEFFAELTEFAAELSEAQ